jgi:hypothetical protein
MPCLLRRHQTSAWLAGRLGRHQSQTRMPREASKLLKLLRVMLHPRSVEGPAAVALVRQVVTYDYRRAYQVHRDAERPLFPASQRLTFIPVVQQLKIGDGCSTAGVKATRSCSINVHSFVVSPHSSLPRLTTRRRLVLDSTCPWHFGIP